MDSKSSALCLFDDQNVQMDITSNILTDHHPINNIMPGAPIEFNIPGTPDEYIDLGDIQMLLKLKIIKTDGKAWDSTTDKVNFINLPLASVFQDVFLKVSDTQVEGGQHMYPYNAYMSTLLQFHPSAKKTHLTAWGWNEDSPGKFDDDTNEGILFRRAETESGKSWELMGPLFLDLTRQPRYLLPQTSMRLKLLPAKAKFVLQTTTATTGYDYEIEKCILYVRRIRVNDSVQAGHNKGLMKQNAKYILNLINITSFTITKGNSSYIKDNLFATQIPKLLVVGLLDHDAFNGNMKKSPFNFQHFNLTKIGLYRDGELTPGHVFNMDYDNKEFLQAYNNTMSALNYYNTDDTNGITLEHFVGGYNLYAFDMTPDANCHASHRNLMKTGSLRLEFNFGKPLANPINVLLFSVLDSKIEITKLRDIIMTYSR